MYGRSCLARNIDDVWPDKLAFELRGSTVNRPPADSLFGTRLHPTSDRSCSVWYGFGIALPVSGRLLQVMAYATVLSKVVVLCMMFGSKAFLSYCWKLICGAFWIWRTWIHYMVIRVTPHYVKLHVLGRNLTRSSLLWPRFVCITQRVVEFQITSRQIIQFLSCGLEI